jgi:hypothetical protein
MSSAFSLFVMALACLAVGPVAEAETSPGFKSDGETCKPGTSTGYEGCINISGHSVSGTVKRYLTEKEDDCGDFKQELIAYTRNGNQQRGGEQVRPGVCMSPGDRWSAPFTGIDPKKTESSYSDQTSKPYYSRMCVTGYKRKSSADNYVPITNLTCRDVTE